MRADSPEMVADVGRRISTTLRLHPEEFVSYAAGRMETRANRVFRYSQKRPGLSQNAHMAASQYAAFHPGAERVDAHLELLGTTATLVRDDDCQFGDMLDLAFSYGQQLDDMPGAWAYGAQRPLTCIRACRRTSSVEEFGIQLADLVAGLFGRVALTALSGKSTDASKRAVVRAWRSTLLPCIDHYWMLADSNLNGVLEAFFDADAS